MITIDATGLHPTTLAELQASQEADLRGEIAQDLDLSPDQPLGQVNAIYAATLAEICEVIAYLYTCFDPGSAEGVQLDNLCAITGTYRRAATAGLVSVNLALQAGVTVPAGSIVASPTNAANQWQLTAAVTSSGAGSYPGVFQCLETGPVALPAGTLSIQTPVAGWTSAANPTDAALGLAAEKDSELRTRRVTELSASGSSTLDAIRADLQNVSGVISAVVTENTAAFPVGSLPPKSVECVVWDGVVPAASNDNIAKAIWTNKPAGIEFVGSQSGATTDLLGVSQTVRFTRVSQKNVYIVANVSVDFARFPVDGVAQITSKILAYGATLAPGSACVRNAIESAIFGVAGVLDTPSTFLGLAPSPVTSANLVASASEICVLDSARIVVILV